MTYKPHDQRLIDTDRIEAVERAAKVLHQGGQSEGSASMPAIDAVLSELKEIRAGQTEIKISLATGEARFRAIEEWQRRHDATHSESRNDLKDLLKPALGQLLWILIAGGIGYLAAHLKP